MAKKTQEEEQLSSFADTKKSDTHKHHKMAGNVRRNMWLLIVTTILVIGSIFMFTPLQERIHQGLDLQGGLSVVLTAQSTDGGDVSNDDMNESRSIIESRVNALGASEASVQRQGNNQILVQIPGMSDTSEALRTIGRTGQLEFARLDSFTDSTIRQEIDSGQLTQSSTITDDFGNTFRTGEQTPITVQPGTYTPIITGANIRSVNVDRENGSGVHYAVNITLDDAGRQAFADASRDLVGDHGKIVIILDNQVQSAPAVQSVIDGGEVSITGNYTQQEANDLKTVLDSGALPVSFQVQSARTVGPTLGQGALQSGVLVAGIGLLLVMLYLLLFYRGLGFLTAGAMAVFAVMYLGLLALLSHFNQFSLSLAGIAGIVLTIGMAADSSILTLERFREEIRFGRSVRAASITGVRHGIMTSIDADLVTLVSALTLFFLGSSSVKGFGLTLALGIGCDIAMMLLFKAPTIRLLAPHSIAHHPGFWGIKDCETASEVYTELAHREDIPVERAVSYEAINSKENKLNATRRAGEAGAKAADAASNLKGRFIKHDIKFLKYRKFFLTLAACVVVVFCVVIGVRGINLGIEFVGGTSIEFDNTGSLTTDQLRQELDAQGQPNAVIQTVDNNGESGFIVRTSETDAADASALATQVSSDLNLADNSFQVSTIGPDWGTSIIHSMVLALAVSFLLIIIYIAIRFEYKMGITAIIALCHDIILVLGIYALLGRELTPNTVAALLTILGYSLYDTVVVFHRITDNLQHLHVKCTFMTMANHSMNQVFIRSINTTLTSIIPVAAMMIFGSQTLQDFAFAMTIGLISGAYSSIAIACPLYVLWKQREPKYKKLVKKYGNEVGVLELVKKTATAQANEEAAEKASAGVSTGTATQTPGAVSNLQEASANSTSKGKKGGSAHVEGAVLTNNGQLTVVVDAPKTGAQLAKEKRAKERKAQSRNKAAEKKKEDAKEEANTISAGVPGVRYVEGSQSAKEAEENKQQAKQKEAEEGSAKKQSSSKQSDQKSGYNGAKRLRRQHRNQK